MYYIPWIWKILGAKFYSQAWVGLIIFGVPIALNYVKWHYFVWPAILFGYGFWGLLLGHILWSDFLYEHGIQVSIQMLNAIVSAYTLERDVRTNFLLKRDIQDKRVLFEKRSTSSMQDDLIPKDDDEDSVSNKYLSRHYKLHPFLLYFRDNSLQDEFKFRYWRSHQFMLRFLVCSYTVLWILYIGIDFTTMAQKDDRVLMIILRLCTGGLFLALVGLSFIWKNFYKYFNYALIIITTASAAVCVRAQRQELLVDPSYENVYQGFLFRIIYLTASSLRIHYVPMFISVTIISALQLIFVFSFRDLYYCIAAVFMSGLVSYWMNRISCVRFMLHKKLDELNTPEIM